MFGWIRRRRDSEVSIHDELDLNAFLAVMESRTTRPSTNVRDDLLLMALAEASGSASILLAMGILPELFDCN